MTVKRNIEPDIPNEIMTLPEIASYLKVSEKTILRMVKKRTLPGSKVSNQWRFQRAAIEQWLTAKTDAPDDHPVDVFRRTPKTVFLAQLIERGRILMNIESGDKSFVLRQLIKPLVDDALLDDPEEFLSNLLEREAMGSTGIGDGVAIPHVREQVNSGVRRTCVVVGLCKEGLDFDALDKAPTYVFMLLCGNSVAVHLRLLAKTMLMLRNHGMVQVLLQCESRKDVEELLKKADCNLSV